MEVVKCQNWAVKKKKTCILLFYFSRVHWGRHLILKCFIWIYKKNGVDFTSCSYYSAWHDRWLVETLSQGCLRNNLLHLWKKKKKNTFECHKKKGSCFFLLLFFFLSPSQFIRHSHAHQEHKSNLSWESGIFFFQLFRCCCCVTARRAACFCL